MTSEANTETAIALCRQSIALHSKSFSLAAKLLPARCRDDVTVLYAWCRRADDTIDEQPDEVQLEELARLRAELDDVYAGKVMAEPVLAAFQDVVQRYDIPRSYPVELLAGMEMDATGQQYPDMKTLTHYCYRVASTVGLMMSHIIGLSRSEAMTNAAHLGIGMQLSNICRDVMEDWERGRLYLPDDLLVKHGAGALRSHLGGPFPDALADQVACAVRELLTTADVYYRSGDRGMSALPWRAALGVRTARLVYSRIGREVQRAGCDVRAGRAYVTRNRKLLLVARAGATSIIELPGRWIRAIARRAAHATPVTRVEFSNDVICV